MNTVKRVVFITFGQLITFCFCIATTGLCTATTFWSQWIVSGPSSQLFVDPVWTWRSLWEVCIQYAGEQYSSNLEVSGFKTEGTDFMSSLNFASFAKNL